MRRATWLLLALLVPAAVILAGRASLFADQLTQRSLQIESSRPSANTQYTLNFTIASIDSIGSIRAQFCANDPLIDTPCTPPAGFDVSQAVLISQNGETGFIIDPATTANVLVLSRSPIAASPQPSSYTLSGVINPSSAGSYYVRLQTYPDTLAGNGAGAGPAIDYGGLAFNITSEVNISSEVPPFLLFCTALSIPSLNCASASGDYINFGAPSASSTLSGQSQMLVATNADNGYVIGVNGTTLTSGNNEITALTLPDTSRTGQAQFGLNLRANSSPPVGSDPDGPGAGSPTPSYNQPNVFRFLPNDSLATSVTPSEPRRYTVSYIINIPAGQPAGIYVSTLTYVATGSF